jgi:electron transfer flavoprotein beta subunit
VKIVVTIKLVPNPNAEKRIDPQTKRLVRTGVETVLNPYDEYALEAALQLKERAGGDTTVTIFSMAPDSLKEGLRRALAMGADDAVVLSDEALEGSDVSATAFAMAAALKTLKFDLLVVGGLTDDSSTGAVPGALAEHLGLPCITNARKVEIKGDAIEVERETDSGYQMVHGPLPALLTTALTFGEPRYASLKGIMGAKKKSIASISLQDLSLDRPVGTSGSKTELRSFAPPPVRGKGQVVEASDGLSGAQAIFDFLAVKRLV